MRLQELMQRTKDELGISTLLHASRDVHILLLTRCIRMFAYGSSTLVLALYFAALGLSDTKIGLFMTLTLIGDVGLSLLLTLIADSLGRRRILIAGGILMAISGVVFATATNYWLLLLVAVVGVISPSGNEIGPFKAIEESTLAHLSDAKTRSDIFAFYVVVGTLGGAGGFLAGGWITQALQATGWSEAASFRFIFWIYAAAGLCKAALTSLLSSKCEVQPAPIADTREQNQSEETEAFLPATGATTAPAKKQSAVSKISPKSRKTLLKLCSLFFFDSLASGMCPNSLIAFFLSRKFGLPEGQLGSIIASAQFVSSIGNVFASAIAKRIGFVKTMVFTHLPSAIFLSLMPLPTSLWLTIMLLVLRASLSSMDQAPRSAFLSAVVLPDERTAVMGIVNTVKTMSQSSGPLLTGSLAESGRFWIAFVFAGALKAAYDLGLLTFFLNTKLEGDDSKAVPSRTSTQDPELELDNVRERASEDKHRLSLGSPTSGEPSSVHRAMK
jgi:MFS family permease